jgi:hypothetical protein
VTQPPPEPPGTSAVGPLAVEAALLLDVVADRLSSLKRSTTPDPESEAEQPDPAPADGRCPECGSMPGAYCTACPLCRFMALLRGERPEATAKLVDGALMIIRTLRSLVPDPPDTAHPHPHSHSHPHSPAEPPTQHQSRKGGLEHIDIL